MELHIGKCDGVDHDAAHGLPEDAYNIVLYPSTETSYSVMMITAESDEDDVPDLREPLDMVPDSSDEEIRKAARNSPMYVTPQSGDPEHKAISTRIATAEDVHSEEESSSEEESEDLDAVPKLLSAEAVVLRWLCFVNWKGETFKLDLDKLLKETAAEKTGRR